jgi:hypothetical protein
MQKMTVKIPSVRAGGRVNDGHKDTTFQLPLAQGRYTLPLQRVLCLRGIQARREFTLILARARLRARKSRDLIKSCAINAVP